MASEYRQDQEEYITKFNLLDKLAVIVKYRRMIFSLCSLSVIIAVIISLNLTKIYSSTIVIMPPRIGKSSASSLISKLGINPGSYASGGKLRMHNPTALYEAMITSRTMLDIIIKRFNLREAYGQDKMDPVRRALAGKTIIITFKANTFGIEVEDVDPQRAADIANAYVEELDRMNQKFTVSGVRLQRIFLERRIEGIKKQLQKAEINLKEFQEKNKIVSLSTQTSTSIYGASRIKGQILSVETKLEVLKSFATGKSNKILQMEKKLGKLKQQLERIENGPKIEDPYHPGNLDNSGKPAEDSNFYIPFTRVPDLGLQLSRLIRNVKVKETIYELLTQQYELAKIAESKDIATIQVLDKAVVSESRKKPARTRIVTLTGIITFIASLILAFFLDHFDKMQPEKKELLQDIKRDLKRNIPFVGK